MDNISENSLPSPIEQRFAKRFTVDVKDNNSGEFIKVHEGIPRENYAGQGVINVPYEPHIFNADNFELYIGGNRTVDTKNVRVLLMHGTVVDGQWYPLDPKLQDKGITVEDLVKAYEDSSDKTIDALFVCRPPKESRVRIVQVVKVVPFQGTNEKPRIYMKDGDAHGAITINEKTGNVSVTMRADSEDQIEFKDWKNSFSVPEQQGKQEFRIL
jgi:hypothetical protein